MARRPTLAESDISRSLRNFKAEFDVFYTYSDWNISAALLLTIATNFVAYFLNLLEPRFAICLGYMEALSSFNVILFYQISMLLLISYMVFIFAGRGVYKTQIIILWLQLISVPLIPYMYSSMTSCYPDIQMPRPMLYQQLYTVHRNREGELVPKHCPVDMNNCYRGYYSTLMIVLTSSLITGLYHTVIYGKRAYYRLSTITPRGTPARRPLIGHDDDDDVLRPLSDVDDDEYAADLSSMQSPDEPDPTKPPRVKNPRRGYLQRFKKYSSSSESYGSASGTAV